MRRHFEILFIRGVCAIIQIHVDITVYDYVHTDEPMNRAPRHAVDYWWGTVTSASITTLFGPSSLSPNGPRHPKHSFSSQWNYIQVRDKNLWYIRSFLIKKDWDQFLSLCLFALFFVEDINLMFLHHISFWLICF